MKKNAKLIAVFIIIGVALLFMPKSQEQSLFNDINNGAGYNRKGGSGLALPETFAISPGNVLLGKYHNAYVGLDEGVKVVPLEYVFDLQEYKPIGNGHDTTDFAKVLGEPRHLSRTEIPIIIVNMGALYNGGFINYRWYRDEDNKLLFSWTHMIPDPSTEGEEYWAWYSTYTWLGYFSHEIDRVGDYHVDISSSWGNERVDFEIIDSSLMLPFDDGPQTQDNPFIIFILIGLILNY